MARAVERVDAEVGEEHGARFERGNEERLAARVVGGDLGSELCDPYRDLVGGEIDLSERATVSYEARVS